MNNMTVLVLFVIELVSGYIVPTTVSEIKNETALVILNSTATIMQPITNTLENITLITNNEIYQNSEVKATNVSERSLIFINKRLKTLLKGPSGNNYQAFILKHGQDIQEMIQNGKPYAGTQVPVKQLQQLLYPNAKLRNPKAQAVYRYVHTESVNRNKSCENRGRPVNRIPFYKVEDAEATKPFDQTYVIKTPVKVMDIINTHELFKNYNDFLNTNHPSGSDVGPEQHSKNMIITSHRHRKPKSNGKDCGFLKHQSFHKMTHTAGDHKVSSLEDINFDDAGAVYNNRNLDQFIKQTLIELENTEETNKDNWDDETEIKKTKTDIQEVNSNLKREVSAEAYES